MRYPVLLRIYVPYSDDSKRLFSIHVLGFLLGEPRKNSVISFNFKEHVCDPLKFKYVEEDLDNGRFDIVCHNVESDSQDPTEAKALAVDIEESLKRLGWIECNEDGVPTIPPVLTINGINVYSDKQPLAHQVGSTRINFLDGSWCDVGTRQIVNIAPGFIFLAPA